MQKDKKKAEDKKRYDTPNPDNGSKKGSATGAGYDEQNEMTSKSPKANPAPSKTQDKPSGKR